MYDADIPLPEAVYTLSNLFARQGFTLFAVGGVVRDYLYSQWHGGSFDPKDVDLATEATPEQVSKILRSKEAANLKISCFPKGESFGVISAIVDGEEYEIATFREEWYDPDTGDGRRPDQVKFSTPENDAKRRDLTINALFYDLNQKKVYDYNDGQGLEDIKNLVARPVGNAFDRFREDKLRVLRLVRFFCRFNGGLIVPSLDDATLDAVRKFRRLEGVSPERITNEFIAGLTKCVNPVNYILNYKALGLFPAVFDLYPDLAPQIDPEPEKIGQCRNVKAVLAWLFSYTANARKRLNELKYSNDISDRVDFLLKLQSLRFEDIAGLLKRRDLYKQLKKGREEAWEELQKDLRDFAKIIGHEEHFEFFLNYQPIAKSQDFLHLSGPAISKAMAEAEENNYWLLWGEHAV